MGDLFHDKNMLKLMDTRKKKWKYQQWGDVNLSLISSKDMKSVKNWVKKLWDKSNKKNPLLIRLFSLFLCISVKQEMLGAKQQSVGRKSQPRTKDLLISQISVVTPSDCIRSLTFPLILGSNPISDFSIEQDRGRLQMTLS